MTTGRINQVTTIREHSQKSRATKLISEKSVCHVDSEIVLPQVAIRGRYFIHLVPQTNLGLGNVQRGRRVSHHQKDDNKTTLLTAVTPSLWPVSDLS
jgi:hypothetical protein